MNPAVKCDLFKYLHYVKTRDEPKNYWVYPVIIPANIRKVPPALSSPSQRFKC